MNTAKVKTITNVKHNKNPERLIRTFLLLIIINGFKSKNNTDRKTFESALLPHSLQRLLEQ